MSKQTVSFDVVSQIGVVFVEVDGNLSEKEAEAKAREILEENGCGDYPDEGIEFSYNDGATPDNEYIFREVE